MPELPEIETIKSVIEPQINGLTIETIIVNRPEVIAQPGSDEFCKAVTGQTISAMARRGKFLILHLENESRIILHLRMTGCLPVASCVKGDKEKWLEVGQDYSPGGIPR